MRATSIKWHRKLAWIAGLFAIGWALTGILHPILVWTSPVAAARMPPVAPLDLTGARPLAGILADQGVDSVAEARAVTLDNRTLYQIRTGDSPIRRYFDPITGSELAGGDQMRAVSLARHYLGDTASMVQEARLITQFDNEYPPVNRLLPVWRVELARDDGLVAYVDTGGGRLGAISDARKRLFQATFRAVHTLSFVPAEAGPVRVILIVALIGSILAATLLGIALLVLIRRRNRAPGARHWHRVLGYATAIPALAFTISGLWHVLHGRDGASDAAPNVATQVLTASMLTTDLAGLWANVRPDDAPTGLSFLADPDGGLLLRLVPPKAAPTPAPAVADEHAHHDHGAEAAPTPHQARLALFQGIATGGAGLLLDAGTLEPVPGNEATAARRLAITLTGADIAPDADITLVTRFGPDYGFANKRLPVWRVDLAHNRALFVDLADATIAGTIDPADRRALWVFDIFHKGGFMDDLGSVPRDIILMIAASLIAAMAGIGLSMLVRRRR